MLPMCPFIPNFVRVRLFKYGFVTHPCFSLQEYVASSPAEERAYLPEPCNRFHSLFYCSKLFSRQAASPNHLLAFCLLWATGNIRDFSPPLEICAIHENLYFRALLYIAKILNAKCFHKCAVKIC